MGPAEMTEKEPEWGDLALSHNRDEFAAGCPFPFLFAKRSPLKPLPPQRTLVREITGVIPIEELEAGKKDQKLVVLPVRKVQGAFCSMITVGRTANNDVVISDTEVSKFHAYFRRNEAGAWEVTDAGSRNGTWLGGKKLEAKRPVPDHVRGDAQAGGDGVRVPRRPPAVDGARLGARPLGRLMADLGLPDGQ